MNLNKAMIIGNLTRDPEVRSTPGGSQVASFSVATNQVWVDQNGQKQERPEYHNIVAWKKLAEIVGKYLTKGSKVYVEGRLQTREWTGQDSIKRYRTEIVADNLIMLGGQTGQSGSRPDHSFAQPSMSSNEPVIDFGDSIEEDEIKVENIPF